MPLQQLVEYFNDRFSQEHQSSFRPLLLENSSVSGLFGPVRINSKFNQLRDSSKPEAIVGYQAQIEVSTYDPLQLKEPQFISLLTNCNQSIHFDSIINFDRLARTVHMLNYLPLSHLPHTLFLEVDPRHILNIKKDHGAYFEEVIKQCGLQTSQVVIVTALNLNAPSFHQHLLEGLENYRLHGYRIGIRINCLPQSNALLNYISTLEPNFVSISSRYLEAKNMTTELIQRLQALQKAVRPRGKLILQQIDEKRFAQLASQNGIELVEGSYYRTIAFDYRKQLNLETCQPGLFG